MPIASGQFEVLGPVVKSYFDGFKLVPHVPLSIFAKHGLIPLGPEGEPTFDATVPYPLERVLAAVDELVAIVGPRKTFEMGLEVVKNAVVPPGATDIFSAMKVFDWGYHLNHRRNGVVMFDPQGGTMLEGIGHYRSVSAPEGAIVMEVDAPYPCDFDRGIMQSWAARFERRALCTHLDPRVCRKTGAPRCRYEVTWK